ncbi:unnamed protein product, partial [Rotaria magnacalcarata]
MHVHHITLKLYFFVLKILGDILSLVDEEFYDSEGSKAGFWGTLSHGITSKTSETVP